MLKTAPPVCKPKLWIVTLMTYWKSSMVQIENLTTHFNQVDPTGNINFTYGEETNNAILFLGTNIIRKLDSTIKPINNCNNSHRPVHQELGVVELGVVRTLYDQKEKIVTEPVDKQRNRPSIRL